MYYTDTMWHMVASTEPPTPTSTTTLTVGTTTDTTLPEAEISLTIRIWKIVLIGSYGLAMYINDRTAERISRKYHSRAELDVLFGDARVSSISLLGLVIVLASSIVDNPNEYLCILANSACVVSFGWPIVSSLCLAYIR